MSVTATALSEWPPEPEWTAERPPPIPALVEPDALDLVVEMAHDLRSPVASILVLAEALQTGEAGPVNEIQHRQLGLIRSAAYCLCAVASDVLSLAKGNASLVESAPVAFSIEEVIATVKDMVAPLLEYKRVELRTARPALDRRLGHPRALMRVLLNLTTNALKVTDRGWVEITAEQRDADSVAFAVRDTGPGLSLPPDEIRAPFRRDAATHRTAFSSFGLGLTICENLLHLMRSSLRSESRPGGGASFTFTLELPPAPDD